MATNQHLVSFTEDCMDHLDYTKPILSPMKIVNLDQNEDFLIDPFSASKE